MKTRIDPSDFSFLLDHDVARMEDDYRRTAQAVWDVQKVREHWLEQARLCRQELVDRRRRPRANDAAVWDAAERELYREGGQTFPSL